jgi:hypothetical protein
MICYYGSQTCTWTLPHFRMLYYLCLCYHFSLQSDANTRTYEGAPKSFRTGRLKRELQMVQPSATRCSCIAILWVSLVSFAAMTLCVASQRVFIVVVISLSTQSGSFWIHPRSYTCSHLTLRLVELQRLQHKVGGWKERNETKRSSKRISRRTAVQKHKEYDWKRGLYV